MKTARISQSKNKKATQHVQRRALLRGQTNTLCCSKYQLYKFAYTRIHTYMHEYINNRHNPRVFSCILLLGLLNNITVLDTIIPSIRRAFLLIERQLCVGRAIPSDTCKVVWCCRSSSLSLLLSRWFYLFHLLTVNILFSITANRFHNTFFCNLRFIIICKESD